MTPAPFTVLDAEQVARSALTQPYRTALRDYLQATGKRLTLREHAVLARLVLPRIWRARRGLPRVLGSILGTP